MSEKKRGKERKREREREREREGGGGEKGTKEKRIMKERESVIGNGANLFTKLTSTFDSTFLA